MTSKEKHGELLKEWKRKYEPINEKYEFVDDGPSNWNLYENSPFKIMFLAKESINGYHPSTPNQSTQTRFMSNLARWKCLINHTLNTKTYYQFPEINELPQNIDDIAIVEVKKINDGSSTTNMSKLKRYAQEDKEFLKTQIEIINPNIILCCNTIECFDIVFNNKFDSSKRLFKGGGTSCAEVGNRLVIDFFHPSARKGNRYLFQLLTDLLLNEHTQKFKIKN